MKITNLITRHVLKKIWQTIIPTIISKQLIYPKIKYVLLLKQKKQ